MVKKYILILIQQKKNAANSFEKNVFGKTMGNLRKRISAKLVNNAKVYVKCISKPTFVSQTIFDKNFVAIHEIKVVLTVCFYHVTYEFESESTLYSCLNVKELLARSGRHI